MVLVESKYVQKYDNLRQFLMGIDYHARQHFLQEHNISDGTQIDWLTFNDLTEIKKIVKTWDQLFVVYRDTESLKYVVIRLKARLPRR